MIIELVGLPGSGKTTLARALANTDRYTRVKIESNRELLWYNLRFLVRHPVVCIRLIWLWWRYRGPRSLWYTKFTTVLLDYNAKYMKAQRYTHAVLDQGHMQALMSLFENELAESELERVVAILPKADHYVFFNISSALRSSQIDNRGYRSRSDFMDDELWQHWQETAAHHFSRLVSFSDQLGPATSDVVTDHFNVERVVERYQKARFIRYITFARMPTEKAHGLQIATMCTEFAKLGHFVSLVTPRRVNEIRETVTDYYELETPLVRYFLRAPDVIGSFRRLTPVHHYLHELLFAFAVLLMPLRPGLLVYTRTPFIAKVATWRSLAVVIEMHYWPNSGQRLTAWLIAQAAIFTNSVGTARAVEAAGLSATVANNGYPTQWLEIVTPPVTAKAALGIVTDLPVVMYVGSLDGWKGVDTLCEATVTLSDQVKTVVIGGSADLAAWQQRYPHVQFCGARPYRDLGYNQQAAAMLVVPNNPIGESERYTSPIKLFAHMASDRPVIISDLPAMRAIVDDTSAYFFTPGDAESLRTVITTALTNKAESAKRAAAAKALATDYTWSKRAFNIMAKLEV